MEALAVATPDEAIVAYAVRTNRIVVTQDTSDFLTLYAKLSFHPGLILLYSATGLAPDAKLAAALDNVATTYPNIDNTIFALHDLLVMMLVRDHLDVSAHTTLEG